jgi:hypothetical protein
LGVLDETIVRTAYGFPMSFPCQRKKGKDRSPESNMKLGFELRRFLIFKARLSRWLGNLWMCQK